MARVRLHLNVTDSSTGTVINWLNDTLHALLEQGHLIDNGSLRPDTAPWYWDSKEEDE